MTSRLRRQPPAPPPLHAAIAALPHNATGSGMGGEGTPVGSRRWERRHRPPASTAACVRCRRTAAPRRRPQASPCPLQPDLGGIGEARRVRGGCHRPRASLSPCLVIVDANPAPRRRGSRRPHASPSSVPAAPVAECPRSLRERRAEG